MHNEVLDAISKPILVPPQLTGFNNGTSVRPHTPFFYFLLDVMRPKTFVELGVYYGDNFYAVCNKVQQSNLPTKCFAIDNWRGNKQYGFYDESVFTYFSSNFNRHNFKCANIIRCEFDEAVAKFEEGSIDMIHIDGGHLYEEAKNDYEKWLPKMNHDTGIMLFHDLDLRVDNSGVWKLWDELKPEYPNFEFHFSFGLGMIYIGEKVPPKPLYALVTANPEDTSLIQQTFQNLGQTL